MMEMEVNRVQISSKAYHRVVLKEKDGESCLHIVIGPNEARAISLAHNGQKPIRPLSYDLACTLLEEADAHITKVTITDLREGIYYAEVHLQSADGTSVAVDCRPSDAIALAVRTKAPIFAAEHVLEEEGSDPEADEETPAESQETSALEELLMAQTQAVELSEADLLRQRLERAVSEEAYEEAARLRDRISLLQEGRAEETADEGGKG